MPPVKPEIKSFLIADMVIQEKNTNKWSAIGIFDNIYAKRFPCIQTRIGLYIRLADAEGEYNIRVEFCDENARKLAMFEGIKLKIASRVAAPDFGIQTHALQIPKPGKYWFNLFFNDEFVRGLPLEVVSLEK